MKPSTVDQNQELFVEVVLPRPLEGTLTYRLTTNIPKDKLIGAWVLVPLGKEKILACIWSVHIESELADHKLKSVLAWLQWLKPLPVTLIQLLSALSKYYLVPLGESLSLAMPRWISKAGHLLNSEISHADSSIMQGELIFETHLKRLEDLPIFDSLQRISQWTPLFKAKLPFYVSAREWSTWKKTTSLIELKVPQSSLDLNYRWRKQKSFSKQIHLRGTIKDIFISFAESSEIDHQDLLKHISHRQELTIKKALRTLLSQGHLKLSVHSSVPSKQQVDQRINFENSIGKGFTLSDEQQDAVQAIKSHAGFKVSLLHGVTGSGKTEVYLDLIDSLLKQGKQALVLVPEIGLTPQTVERFKKRFSVPIYSWHSQLSPKERIQTWHQLSWAGPCILIGARSALFAPLHHLGVIIVDESHDASYKQGDGIRYNARDMAILRASQEACPVILGTATPSLESMQNAYLGKYQLVELKHRPTGAVMPKVKIVDLKTHKAVSQDATAITYTLAQAIAHRLQRREQSILFLNRRGFSQSIRCVSCGYLFACPQCQSILPWHLQSKGFECHHCDFKAPIPSTCPQCLSPDLSHTGRGTEKIEQQLLSLFPKAKITRLDQDSSLGAQELHQLMHSDQVDILIGTQMVTKGHDFPRVTLVGVIDADVGVDLPDFRASERSFQLLSQVAGRAGRAHLAGEVIVQTYRPQEERLLAAMHHDYQRFFIHEMTLREVLAYPPFSYLASVRIQGPPSEHLKQTLQLISDALSQSPLRVRGPSIAPINTFKGQERWIILLISEQRSTLHAELNKLKPLMKKQTRLNIRCIIDVDPIDFS